VKSESDYPTNDPEYMYHNWYMVREPVAPVAAPTPANNNSPTSANSNITSASM
jgi:hypothetical protein